MVSLSHLYPHEVCTISDNDMDNQGERLEIQGGCCCCVGQGFNLKEKKREMLIVIIFIWHMAGELTVGWFLVNWSLCMMESVFFLFGF